VKGHRNHCGGSSSDVREAQLSFPSGHSSIAACGLGFLSWLLHGVARAQDGSVAAKVGVHLAQLWLWLLRGLSAASVAGAGLIAASRNHDYW
jgi:membrane-associated phospholipid phosphatase